MTRTLRDGSVVVEGREAQLKEVNWQEGFGAPMGVRLAAVVTPVGVILC
jgi:hypothetical protein